MYPSPHPLQSHVQVEQIDLFRALNRHHLGSRDLKLPAETRTRPSYGVSKLTEYSCWAGPDEKKVVNKPLIYSNVLTEPLGVKNQSLQPYH